MSELSLVRKTVVVLQRVASASQGVGLSDLSRAVGIPKATCLRILNDLGADGIVQLDEETKRYGLGLGALSVIGRLIDPASLFSFIQQELRNLTTVTQETSGLDILVDREVLVIAQVASPEVISQTANLVPRRLQTWNTSTGKVLLAGLAPDEVIKDHHTAVLAAADTWGTPAAFLDELEMVRARGYATARDEMAVGAAAVAAPVIVGGRVVAAVWIGGPTFRITPERVPELAADVRITASRVATLVAASGGRLTGTTRQEYPA